MPILLSDRPYADFRSKYEIGLEQLRAALTALRDGEGPAVGEHAMAVADEGRGALDLQVATIRQEHRAGNLVLFCGAGVGSDAGLPDWGQLLNSLLIDLFNRGLSDGQGMPISRHYSVDETRNLAECYQGYFDPNALMIAQYLKNFLGTDFLNCVRVALYSGSADRPGRREECRLIPAIVELCRPQRSREALRSIVTFNFDDVLEQFLKKHSIKYRSIYAEGQKASSSELPIYHVHGFLPEDRDLAAGQEIVFSEDAYHTQFIDAFSWSNLIQLNHLNQHRCLFVGLSMTDPNLRRLLDIARRRNPDNFYKYHFVFKKKVNKISILKFVNSLKEQGKLKSVEYPSWHADQLARIEERLEEEDASKLGLNVIWVDDHDEIPHILERICADD